MRDIWRNAGAYIALIAVTLLFAALTPEFRQPSNLLNVLDQSVRIGIVSVGMTAIIITGGIDLSVGSIAALAPFLAASYMASHGGPHSNPLLLALAGLLLTVAVGAACGGVSGLTITRAYLPPFIATLGMMSVVRGLAYILSKGTGINEGIPAAYTITGQSLVAIRTGTTTSSLTWAVALMAAVFIGGHVVLTRTSVGRAIYAIGGNEQAARLSGLNVDSIKLGVYIMGGILAALSGLVETASVGVAAPQAGSDLELDAIAAVCIGGTSLFGGRGNLAGTFAGVLLMRVIRNGLNLINVDSNWQRVAIGGIIMAAVGFDEIQKRRVSVK
jgi:ribose transport system permease protein